MVFVDWSTVIYISKPDAKENHDYLRRAFKGLNCRVEAGVLHWRVVDEHEPVTGDESAVLLGHTSRHQGPAVKQQYNSVSLVSPLHENVFPKIF